jgi:hypothetical protein
MWARPRPHGHQQPLAHADGLFFQPHAGGLFFQDFFRVFIRELKG